MAAIWRFGNVKIWRYLQNYIADLVELDSVLDRHGFILFEALEQAREQSCANHLVLYVG